jgi:hypothetical protein
MSEALTLLKALVEKCPEESAYVYPECAYCGGSAHHGTVEYTHSENCPWLAASKFIADHKDTTEPHEAGEISDGFGSVWLLCKPDCGIQVVRPGKAQCECDFKE